MISIKIGAQEAQDFARSLEEMAQAAMPNLQSALDASAALAQAQWQKWAGGHHVEGVALDVERPTGSLAKSIRTRSTGEFSREVFSTAKYMDFLESGTAGADLKETHPFGARSRVAKDEKTGETWSYLIVPFFWGTPTKSGKRPYFYDVMGEKTYGAVKKFEETLVKKSAADSGVFSPNARGEMVGRATYSQGGRLKKSDAANEIGMIRTGDPNLTHSDGRKAHGGYMTFRVVSSRKRLSASQKAAGTPNSKWVVPPLAPRHAAKGIEAALTERIDKMLTAALEKDFFG